MDAGSNMAPDVTVLEAFFVEEEGSFRPSEMARGWWSKDSLHGRALVGLMGTVVADRHGCEGMVPARFTIDMFRLAPFGAVSITTKVVREGPRIVLVEAEMSGGGRPVARATMQFLRRAASPPGKVWSPSPWHVPPPEAVPETPDRAAPHYFEVRGIEGRLGEHGPRKQWMRDKYELIAGKPLSPYARAALAADFASAFVHCGDRGIRYINTDVSLHLHRLPVGEWIGFETTGHDASQGIAVGHCRIYDVEGPFGFIDCTALANERRRETT